MPNLLSANGLQIESLAEIVLALTTGYQDIYGADINTDSNSPDGQAINLYAQSNLDQLSLLLDVYNSFSPAGAYGVILDQRLALNGLTRKAGTNTLVYVQVTATQALTLAGLYTSTPPTVPISQPGNTQIFTVADATGNQYQLLQSYAYGAAGIATLAFIAVNVGQVLVTQNTIIQIVTITNGISSVNNPLFTLTTTGTTSSTAPQITAIPTTVGITPGMLATGVGINSGVTVVSVDSATQVTLSQNSTASASVAIVFGTQPTIPGINEENDAQYRIRQASSFYLASTGMADAIEAQLLAIHDVVTAVVLENETDTVDANGTAAYGIQCIVVGGQPSEIGAAIYAKKSPGCAQTGANTYVFTRPNGTTFTAQWVTGIPEPLYVELSLTPIGGVSFNTTTIAAAIAAALNGTYALGQAASIGQIITAMNAIAPQGICSSVGVSDAASGYEDIFLAAGPQYYWTVLASNIAITLL